MALSCSQRDHRRTIPRLRSGCLRTPGNAQARRLLWPRGRVACVRSSCVNQDMAGSSLDQVALHPPHTKGQRETKDLDVWRHVGHPPIRAVASGAQRPRAAVGPALCAGRSPARSAGSQIPGFLREAARLAKALIAPTSIPGWPGRSGTQGLPEHHRDDVRAHRTCTRVPPDRTPGRCAALCRQHAHLPRTAGAGSAVQVSAVPVGVSFGRLTWAGVQVLSPHPPAPHLQCAAGAGVRCGAGVQGSSELSGCLPRERQGVLAVGDPAVGRWNRLQ